MTVLMGHRDRWLREMWAVCGKPDGTWMKAEVYFTVVEGSLVVDEARVSDVPPANTGTERRK